MYKYQLLKLLFKYPKNSNQGISLTELLVALVISGIVLTAGTSGFINLLRVNQDNDSKTVRSSTLTKALAYMQTDIRGARSVTAVTGGICTGVNSTNCLALTYPDGSNLSASCGTNSINPVIYYGYENIASSSTTSWLKPGVLKRKVACNNTPNPDWGVIADGLVSSNEDPITINCSADGTPWPNNDSFGQDTTNATPANTLGGGFRFCLGDNTATNRLVRVFLIGHVIGSTTTIKTDVVGFARSQ